MPRRGATQRKPSGERQIGIRIVLGDGAARALDHLRIGRNIDVEILEPQEVGARGVGERAHAIDPDACHMNQTPRSSCHGRSPLPHRASRRVEDMPARGFARWRASPLGPEAFRWNERRVLDLSRDARSHPQEQCVASRVRRDGEAGARPRLAFPQRECASRDAEGGRRSESIFDLIGPEALETCERMVHALEIID
jgi:hypothetical protein